MGVASYVTNNIVTIHLDYSINFFHLCLTLSALGLLALKRANIFWGQPKINLQALGLLIGLKMDTMATVLKAIHDWGHQIKSLVIQAVAILKGGCEIPPLVRGPGLIMFAPAPVTNYKTYKGKFTVLPFFSLISYRKVQSI
jgi:hypothetical protein